MLRTTIRRFKGLSSDEQEGRFEAVKLRKRKQLQQEGCAIEVRTRQPHGEQVLRYATQHVSTGAQLSPQHNSRADPPCSTSPSCWATRLAAGAAV
jgi:hypothetical protein